jgi:8-oxo-dGTP diphosphatase
MTEHKKRLIVTAAIIYDGTKILITKRKPKKTLPGGWEFPGGKIELRESPEECLKRELKEELDLEIENINIFHAIQHEYSDFHIIMIAYKCDLCKNQKILLTEHEDYRWLESNSEDWKKINFLPADIPIIDKLFKQQEKIAVPINKKH